VLTAHYRVDGHPNINTIQEVVIGRQRVYLVLPPCHGDLHSYVRSRRRLREATARALFRQVVAAVHHAHVRGIVLRDLKLRKFVFTDESRTELKLESLEDAVVLEDPQDDILSDKHGCPAYVSPEILKSNTQYSGRAADMWGLGVMLYTMLVGRYPFHGAEHSGLFAKIRRGQFSLPDHLSSRAKCLIRCLLKREPEERLTTEDVLVHPWLTGTHRERSGCSRQRPPHLDTTDHCVPEMPSMSFNGGVPGLAGASSVEKYEAVFRSAATLATASSSANAVSAVPFSTHHQGGTTNYPH
jgi:tribbles-like protein